MKEWMEERKKEGRRGKKVEKEEKREKKKKIIRLLHRLGIFLCVSMWAWAQRADVILQRNLVK